MMDYKEWFDELCETHEREMKQAELRGYARGYQQGLESDVVPHPCNGPLYEKWSAVDYLCKAQEECGEIGEAFGELHRDRDNVEKWTHLMRECCDGIVAITGLMDCLGCDEKTRQQYMKEINESNAKRDGGKRFANEELPAAAPDMMDRHYSKHRVDMLVKELRKVQAYCAEHPRGCRGCALLNLWGVCKLRSSPDVWDLDGAGYDVEGKE